MQHIALRAQAATDRQHYDVILRVALDMVRPMTLPGFNREIYAKHLRKLLLMIENDLARIGSVVHAP